MAFDSFPRALGPPEVHVGGRLQAFLPAWAAITDDLRALRYQRRLQHRASRPSTRRRHPVGSPPHEPGHSSGSKRAMFKGGCGENHRPSRAMPLPCVSRPQALGEISYDPQSKKDQPTHQSSPLQNGDARIHPPPSQAVGLDRVHRPEGCLSSRPYRARVKGPVGIYSGRKHVPIQGSALRPKTRTAPVHKTGRVRGGLPQTARPKTVLLSGRLASGGRVSGLTVPTAALSSPDCAGLGLSNKLGEFGALALAAPDLPRSRHRSARQLARPSPDRVNTIMAAAGGRPQPGSGSNSWGTWPA